MAMSVIETNTLTNSSRAALEAPGGASWTVAINRSLKERSSIRKRNISSMIISSVLLILILVFVWGGSLGWGVPETCDAPGEASMALFDYTSFYSCSSILPPVLKLFLLVAWLLVIISLLASTADNFFVPQLDALSHELGLSEDVAGVTLLALGNGMPDVMTAVSAINKASDFSLSMGEFYGAANFILSFVLGSVLLCSPGTTSVQPWAICRDAICYVFVVIMITVATVDNDISFPEALCFFGAYAGYVTLVVVPGRCCQKCDEIFPRAFADNETEGADVRGAANPLADIECRSGNMTPSTDEVDQIGEDDELEGIEVAMSEGVFVWAQVAIEFLFTLMRHVSIPSATWNRRRRLLAAVCPAGGFLIILLAAQGWAGFQQLCLEVVPVWVICLLAGLLLGEGMLVTSSPDSRPRWYPFLLIFAIVCVVAWFNILANECVAVLETLGLTFGISSSVLGITVLAWGNSVGDLVADTALARQGKARTAVAGCFGSPLLSDLLGLGVSLTSYTARNGDLHVKLGSQNLIAAAFLGCSLLSTIAVSFWYRFKLPRRFAIFLLAQYAAFMIVSVVQESSK